MTESEWLAATDPQPMLEYLRGRASERKSRLFACACCRRIWHLLLDLRGQKGIEVAELYADGLATDEELDAVDDEVADSVNNEHVAAHAVYHACFAPYHDSYYVYQHTLGAATKAAAALTSAAGSQGSGIDWEHVGQVELLHDIFGNPFRPSSPIHPAVLTWNDRLIPRLAQGIYDDRLPDGTLDPSRLGILSDALLDAGCDDERLLSHLRSAGPHVRGCHGLDLILGRS